MRTTLTVVLMSLLLAAPSAQAQEPKNDFVTITRANMPILRAKELIGVLATTGIGLALDQTLRNRIHDPHDQVGRTAADIGNALGSGFVYPTLLGLAVGGKVLRWPRLYGVSSRALKSTLLAGAAVFPLKFIIGRVRPADSPDNNLSFHPVTFKDNSFPSGHTTLAFALATSFSREIDGRWDDAAFYSLASLTAYARMHDDRHWFSDVVFGAGLGILSARFIHRREAKILMGKRGLGVSLAF